MPQIKPDSYYLSLFAIMITDILQYLWLGILIASISFLYVCKLIHFNNKLQGRQEEKVVIGFYILIMNEKDQGAVSVYDTTVNFQ